jgi:hypothetical protein
MSSHIHITSRLWKLPQLTFMLADLCPGDNSFKHKWVVFEHALLVPSSRNFSADSQLPLPSPHDRHRESPRPRLCYASSCRGEQRPQSSPGAESPVSTLYQSRLAQGESAREILAQPCSDSLQVRPAWRPLSIANLSSSICMSHMDLCSLDNLRFGKLLSALLSPWAPLPRSRPTLTRGRSSMLSMFLFCSSLGWGL